MESMNELNVDDLELDELTVTSMRDTVALPETAASCVFCAECFSTVSSSLPT